MTERTRAGHGAAPSQRSFLAVAAAQLVLTIGVNLATPLYAVYQHRFGFPSIVLTSVFAIYAIVLIPSLLVFGQLSDRMGRRRVIVAGLVTAAAGLVLFAGASSTWWLFAARATQGLAVGMIGGAANAALVEFEPHGDRRRAALATTLTQAGGSGAGPLLAGMLAQWAPLPRALCYLVGLAAVVAAIGALLRIPDTPGTGGGWRIQRPAVPSQIRRPFVRLSLTAACAWAVVSLFLSVVPSYAAGLLHNHDLALLGAISALVLAASCAAQLASRGRRAAPMQWGGLMLLAAGLAALILAFPAHSIVVLLAAALLAGTGHGLAIVGSQSDLNDLAPPARRGEVLAAYYTCIYVGVALVITVGLIALGTSLAAAVDVFAAVLACVALITACWQLRVASA